MKKELIPLLAVGAALFTGCSSTGTRYSQTDMPASTLSFSPVTSPQELVKWASLFPNIRSIDTYVLSAPATLPAFSESMPPGTEFREAAGAEVTPEGTRVYTAPAPEGYTVILHRPSQR